VAGTRHHDAIDWELEQHGSNFLSDTQTRPTEAMREAMMTADVGDEQRGADPTVHRLEERVATLMGKEAALFLPTGTMCNAVSWRVHLRLGGDEVILDRTAHPLRYEAAGIAAISGALVCPIDSPRGIFTGADVEAAVRPADDPYAPRSRLVAVENTTNLGGGAVWPLSVLDGVVAAARDHGLRLHLDGARLFNASVAADVPVSRYARDFDTAWVDFTKGLGAPQGAVLCGSRELIEEAWRYKLMLGGGLRQVGFMAAACLHALDHHFDRLADDHRRAQVLAAELAAIDGVDVRPDETETNIVLMRVGDSAAVCARLAAHGVLALAMDPTTVRFVTHMDVDDRDVERAVVAVAAVARRAPARSLSSAPARPRE
jgi:threonine aldolase